MGHQVSRRDDKGLKGFDMQAGWDVRGCGAGLRRSVSALALASCAAMALMAQAGGAQSAGAAQRFPSPGGSFGAPAVPAAEPLQPGKAITPGGTVVEDVIARVNDQIITRSEYERAEKQLAQEAQQTGMSPADFADRQKNLLRDMIDQQLLLSKGKQLGINGDAETVRRLDELRKQNHLDSMEALEKAATQQGVSFEDFKSSIRNNVITQQVVRDEVGRTVSRGMTHANEETFYQAHEKEFEQPEQVHLSEILIPTPENASEAQLNSAKEKAEGASAKIKAGDKFADVAKSMSGGPTAAAGGDLGDFKRGTLGAVLENATFDLPVGGVTAPIRTRQGYVILKVDSHNKAGVPPLNDVEPQVQEAMYLNALQPALRSYLTKARTEAYVDCCKGGLVDTGATRAESKPTFTAYTPPAVKKKQLAKRRLEQERDARAQAQLAEAKERAAEKAQQTAAKGGGPRTVSLTKANAPRTRKIKREKIRFGQAPRTTLAGGTAGAAVSGGLTGQSAAASLAGNTAPGAALAANEDTTVISSGTGGQDEDTAATAGPAAPEQKTRFSQRQPVNEVKDAQVKVKKANEHLAMHAPAATPQEAADEKVQAAPLGVTSAMGTNTKGKKSKQKRVKGQPKERLQEKPQPVETVAVPPEPTTNPKLAATPAGLGAASQGTAEQQGSAAQQGASPAGLPPATAAPPSSLPAGQPLPPAVPTQSTPNPQIPPQM